MFVRLRAVRPGTDARCADGGGVTYVDAVGNDGRLGLDGVDLFNSQTDAEASAGSAGDTDGSPSTRIGSSPRELVGGETCCCDCVNRAVG